MSPFCAPSDKSGKKDTQLSFCKTSATTRLVPLREMRHEGLDQGCNGGFDGFYGGLAAEVAKCLAGDGANGGQSDAARESGACGLKKGDKVARGRGAGEGNGIWIALRRTEEPSQCRNGVRGNPVAISVGYCDRSSSSGKRFGEDITSLGGTDKQNAIAGSFGSERVGEGIGNISWGNEIHLQADSLHCLCRGRADHGDLWQWRFGGRPRPRIRTRGTRFLWLSEILMPLMKDVDGIGAGEDEPVIILKFDESRIERGVAPWGNDLDGGNEDRYGAQPFETSREIRRLMAGSGDENTFPVEGSHVDDCSLQQAGLRRDADPYSFPSILTEPIPVSCNLLPIQAPFTLVVR